MNASRQLRDYLRARRAGTPRDEAAALAGMGLEEARLTDIAESRGELSQIDTTPPAIPAAGNVRSETVPKHDAIDDMPKDHDPLVELAADTLRGDVRDALLGWFKAQPKSWPFMSEREQRDLADAADRFSISMVKQACQIIAAGERPCIVAKLVQYGEKDGVEAKLKLPSTGEVVSALHEACGREVLLVTSGAEEYLGEAGAPVIDADQPGFPLDDGEREAA